MKNILLLSGAVCIILLSCDKKNSSQSDARVKSETICFQGKFIRDACNGHAIVQVLEPLIDSLQESRVLTNTGELLAENVFVTQVPDSFKNGEPFYFSLKGTFAEYFHDEVCSWPKYSAEISNPSHSPCERSAE